jgi:hypothetical protein
VYSRLFWYSSSSFKADKLYLILCM